MAGHNRTLSAALPQRPTRPWGIIPASPKSRQYLPAATSAERRWGPRSWQRQQWLRADLGRLSLRPHHDSPLHIRPAQAVRETALSGAAGAVGPAHVHVLYGQLHVRTPGGLPQMPETDVACILLAAHLLQPGLQSRQGMVIEGGCRVWEVWLGQGASGLCQPFSPRCRLGDTTSPLATEWPKLTGVHISSAHDFQRADTQGGGTGSIKRWPVCARALVAGLGKARCGGGGDQCLGGSADTGRQPGDGGFLNPEG